MDKQNINIFVISSPSGGGKTSLIAKIFEDPRSSNFQKSISDTSRKRRMGDIEGKDYYFVSKEDFELKIQNDQYLCLLYTSPSPRDGNVSRMPSSA